MVLRALSALGAGASSNSETATPYAAPDPTNNATTTYVAGSNQVTLTWVAPNDNGAAISSYTVTAFTAAISGSPASTCTTSTLSCRLSGLANGTTYYVSIQSVNVHSQYSLRSTPRIAVVPGISSSTSLSAAPTSSNYGDSVTLSATVTSGATGTVTFSANGSTIAGCSSVAISSSSAQCVTTALPVGTDSLVASYSGDANFTGSASAPLGFTVDAVAASGGSAPSAPTAPFAPSTPQHLVVSDSGTSVTLTWTPPANSGGAHITRYVVRANPGGATCTTRGATHCVISGLRPQVTYTFTVVAYNSAGVSPPATSNPRAVVRTPSAPRALTVTIVNTDATLTWTPPINSGSAPITRYLVRANPGGATCSTRGATHCVISGLSSASTINFSVVAISRAGESPATHATDVTLGVPIVTVNGGLAVVSWRGALALTWGIPHYRVVLNPGNLRCASVGTTHCEFMVAPNLLHYAVTLQLLSSIGVPVSTVSSTVSEVVLLQTYFATGSYALSPAARVAIADLARSIARNGVASLTIYGHADKRGTAASNLVLSRERADAVAAYLREELARYHSARFDVYVLGGGVSLSSTSYPIDRNVIIVTSSRPVGAVH